MLVFYDLRLLWIKNHIDEKSVSLYMKKMGFSSAIIYGMKEFGWLLYEELISENFDVKCFIDRNAEYIYSDIPKITADHDIPQADIIIVTAVSSFQEIKKILSHKTSIPIVSLYDVIADVSCM